MPSYVLLVDTDPYGGDFYTGLSQAFYVDGRKVSEGTSADDIVEVVERIEGVEIWDVTRDVIGTFKENLGSGYRVWPEVLPEEIPGSKRPPWEPPPPPEKPTNDPQALYG